MKRKRIIKYALALVLLVVCVLLFVNFYKTGGFVGIVAQKSFTLVVLPDTQTYTEKYPEILCAQTDWIVQKQKELNIAFVSQLGDIVQNGARLPEQWARADKCFKTLDGAVPYGIIPGNHDSDKESDKSSGFSKYNQTFPPSRFENGNWYQGDLDGNQNNYEIINASGISLLFVNLEIEPSDEAIKWANDILKKYPDDLAIVTTHKYLYDNGTAPGNDHVYSQDGNTGEQIWEKLVSQNCNVKMVLSGHSHSATGENKIVTKNKCGQDVEQIIQDYQGRDDGQSGLLRTYTFAPNTNGIIDVKALTYSVVTKTFETDSRSQFDFEIRLK